ncbi:hypothetical protein THAOC_33953 [Thalassiosira oceanica]|uniref:DUF6820 domain-containing protein n=1 Tax=Thalassiosira oceanica TaxID=159749 RepID=K0R3A7_THAOC|nr:hypothetical protein THAOC_33953 [Thalassiosira oceanica]|eukprot:EJK47333.1 hypothetical protein THAOC_33953 [Thalassiosira oceanica]
MEHPRPPPSGGCSTARFATIPFFATSVAAKSQAFFARSTNNRGAAEVPVRRVRSPTQISGQKEVWMVPGGHTALQGLSLVPHLTSIAAGFYGSDVINGSETSAGRARAMMLHKIAVAPACLIDNGGTAVVEPSE